MSRCNNKNVILWFVSMRKVWLWHICFHGDMSREKERLSENGEPTKQKKYKHNHMDGQIMMNCDEHRKKSDDIWVQKGNTKYSAGNHYRSVCFIIARISKEEEHVLLSFRMIKFNNDSFFLLPELIVSLYFFGSVKLIKLMWNFWPL